MISCNDVPVLGTQFAISESARSLGVVSNRQLSLAVFFTAVCRASHNQLHQLQWMIQSLSKIIPPRHLSRRSSLVTWTTVTHCCIGSTTGYFAAYSLSVQNSASCLVTGTHRYSDHIIALLRQLQCLPVHQRVTFRVAWLTHRSLAEVARAYLADNWWQLYDVCWHTELQQHPHFSLSVNAPQNSVTEAFRLSPKLWIDLPLRLQQPYLFFALFTQQLKTFLLDYSDCWLQLYLY